MNSKVVIAKRRLETMCADSPLTTNKRPTRKLQFDESICESHVIDENSCGSAFSDDFNSEISDADLSMQSPYQKLYSKTTSVKFLSKKSKSESVLFNEPQIKQALDVDHHGEKKLIGDMSRSHLLPTLKNGKHNDLASISSDTLADLLNGKYDQEIGKYMILDARYPYEYDGGHIKDAENAFFKDTLYQKLFQQHEQLLLESNGKPIVLILHCEFSSERGPKLMREIRQYDRMINKHNYPNLFYPEMYLLEGGYKKFFEEFDGHCAPRDYLPMLHDNHRNELKFFRRKSKTWEMETRKSRVNSKVKLSF